MSIKIVSYNIWFDEEDRKARCYSLIDVKLLENPDVICLQEVIPETLEILRKNLKKYYIFSGLVNDTIIYGCVILTKHKIIKKKIYNLSTYMGRNLLVARIDIAVKEKEGDYMVYDKKQILITTCHYESEFKKTNNTKLKQFDEVSKILRKLSKSYNYIIHCADTNIMKHEENEYLTGENNKYKKYWKDCWVESGNNDNEYTYDYMTNENLKKRKIKLRSRIDRIIYHGFKCIDFNTIKYDRDSKIYMDPSDHHGIKTVLEFI